MEHSGNRSGVDGTARPAEQKIREAVAGAAGDIRDVVDFIHANPELAYEEERSSRYLADRLGEIGFEVELGVAGMDTAFRARLEGGRAGPAVGIVDQYDAVPAVRGAGQIEAVHSCGHGPLAAGVEAAARALASVRDELAGSVEIIGCPADEIHAPGKRAGGGGKARTAAAGLWDGMGAALYAHPEFIDTVTVKSRWMRRLVATVTGDRTMDEQVEVPRRAAATALEIVAGQRSDRAMIESMLIDGDVEEGSGLAVRIEFMLMADSEEELDGIDRELREGIPEMEWFDEQTVPEIRPDEGVRQAVARAIKLTGREFVEDPPPLPFATDFGDISLRAPAALIGIGREGGWKFHTDEGAAEFASPDGLVAATGLAEVLALSVYGLIGTDAEDEGRA